MTVELSKSELITLLKGVQPPYTICEEMTHRGLMKFCGNQWNENWCWEQGKLEELTEEGLYFLYKLCTG